MLNSRLRRGNGKIIKGGRAGREYIANTTRVPRSAFMGVIHEQFHSPTQLLRGAFSDELHPRGDLFELTLHSDNSKDRNRAESTSIVAYDE